MTRLAALLAPLFLIAAAPAEAQMEERVIAALSQNAVGITATFTGSEIFVFGAVERARFSDARDDAIDFIVTLTGPKTPVTVRRRSRVLGVWVNTKSVKVDEAPSFYAVAASAPIGGILNHVDDLRHRISIHRAVRVVGEAAQDAEPQEFEEAVIRLRRKSGVYSEDIETVDVIGRTLFQTHIQLPSNLVEGDYRARVFLLREGRVIDQFATGVQVRKIGLERWIYTLAHEHAALYGALSLIVALFAGWGASEAFRLMRR